MSVTMKKHDFLLLFTVWIFLTKGMKGCPIKKTKSSGLIMSPNISSDNGNSDCKFSNENQTSADCTYFIKSPNGDPISLIFLKMDLEYTIDCSTDYIKITDNTTIDLYTYCGCGIFDRIPVLALSGMLVVEFHTDFASQKKGFIAKYNDSNDQIQMITDVEGTIMSPNFPNQYPNSSTFFYYIQSETGLPLNLTFTYFDVEYTSNCRFDKVIVMDGNSKDAKLFGPLCGNKTLPSIPIIESGTILLIFISGAIYSRPGFSAKFQEVKPVDNSTEPTIATSIESPSSNSVLAIIGTLSGIVLITIIIGVLIFYLRKRAAKSKYQSSPPDGESRDTAMSNRKESLDSSNSKNNQAGLISNVQGIPHNLTYNYVDNTMIKKQSHPECEYVDQEDSYNIVNVHPNKTMGHDIYDRSLDNVYDSARENVDTCNKDTGLYDRSPMDGDYDTTAVPKFKHENAYGYSG